MSFLTRIRFFQKAAVAIFAVYMGTMLFVAGSCYLRKSSSTKMDMAKVQEMRYHSKQQIGE